MKKIIQFGENVEGYSIPVLNEREIRASAGILFLGTFITFVLILAQNNFVPVKYFITFFLTDLLVRVFINPRYAPSLIIGRLIVRNQVPEYVGARQKKFAWMIGIVIASLMYIFLVIINSYSIITGLACLVCLVFLFFETAFGICLGCKIYSLFNKNKAQYCPGETCDKKSRQAIQKISISQLIIIVAFSGYVVFVIWVAGDYYSRHPHDLFAKPATEKLNSGK